jgi:hypothetical protein
MSFLPVPRANIRVFISCVSTIVERYHRTYKQECLLVHRPSTLEEVRVVTEEFQQHSNEQRPHQGRACGNRPPRVACPELPRLPPLPTTVQPDRWLQQFHQHAFVRTVGSDGCVMVDLHTYYVSQRLAGQPVALVVDAEDALLRDLAGHRLVHAPCH